MKSKVVRENFKIDLKKKKKWKQRKEKKRKKAQTLCEVGSICWGKRKYSNDILLQTSILLYKYFNDLQEFYSNGSKKDLFQILHDDTEFCAKN